MNEFMKILLSLSVSGALLLVFILGFKPLYKNRFSKRWQYYIWIVVALRFLLPFTPDTTIVGSLFEQSDTIMITNESPTSPTIPAFVDTDNSETEPIQINRNITADSVRKPFNGYICLFFIWSALALVLFVRKVTIYQSFTKYIKAGNKEVSDIKILNLLSDCEEMANIKTRVELSCNPLVASPIMIGFFRPRIVLPVCELEDKKLSYIFLHELIHYKQRDMFYKWLIQIAACIHWFNPFVYLLEKEVNKSCELSCDEKVISVLDDEARREYGDTLISFLKSDNLYKSSLASVTLTEGAEQLKERLGAIMKFKKKSKYVIAITTIFSVFVCVCFLATGAYAAPSNTNGNVTWENDEIQNEILTEDVAVQCEYMKNLTQEEKKLVMETAVKISENQNETSVKAESDRENGKSIFHRIYTRMTKEELSDELRDMINSCDTETWYVIEKAGYQYIYFGGLPYNYAFQPEISADRNSGEINIFDMGTTTGNYVLLEIQQNVSLTINYNGTQIAYTKL